MVLNFVFEGRGVFTIVMILMKEWY